MLNIEVMILDSSINMPSSIDGGTKKLIVLEVPAWPSVEPTVNNAVVPVFNAPGGPVIKLIYGGCTSLNSTRSIPGRFPKNISSLNIRITFHT